MQAASRYVQDRLVHAKTAVMEVQVHVVHVSDLYISQSPELTTLESNL